MSPPRLRVLFVSRTRYGVPLPAALERRFAALGAELDYHVIARAERAGQGRDSRFTLRRPAGAAALDGLRYHAGLPLAIRRGVATFRPDILICQDPFTAAAALLARRVQQHRPPIVAEVHGDWRTATRLYGSRRRRLLAVVADRTAESAIRRVDAVRAVSRYTASLAEAVRGEPVAATFPAFIDLSAFTERPVEPLPEDAAVLFVGVLEDYKNIDGLATAWRQVARALPHARLDIVGQGSREAVVEALVRELPVGVTWRRSVSSAEVAAALDDARALVLPSRSEGMGRIVLEAFARGRGVIAGAVGGLPELVEDGENGLLVDPRDTGALAGALLTVLRDRELAQTLGAAARESFAKVRIEPPEFARRTRELCERVLGYAAAVDVSQER